MNVLLGIALAILSAVFWGVGGVIFKLGLRGESELSGNLLRSIFAVLFLSPVILIKGIEPLTAELVALVIFSAFFAFFLGDFLYFRALKESAVSYALPLASTYPVYVAILGLIVYGYPLTLNVVLASFLTVLAVVTIPKETGKFTFKSIIAVFAALSWSISMVTLDYLTIYLSPVSLAFLRLVINSAMIYAVVREVKVSRNTLIFMGFLGGFISVAGILSFVTSVKLIGSNLVAPITASSPVIGSLAGKVLLKEKLSSRHVLALVFVFIAVIAISQPPVMITPASEG